MKTQNMFRTVLLLAVLSLVSPGIPALAETSSPVTETPEQKVERMTKRLEEIRAMDLDKLSKSERKALRGEVRTIKKEMKALSGGVYISIGALLLIILLIILLA